jgi:hypothetical protein
VIGRRFRSKLLQAILLYVLVWFIVIYEYNPPNSKLDYPAVNGTIPNYIQSDINTSSLPTTEIEICLNEGAFGGSITGVLGFGFGGWEEDVVGIGFLEKNILVTHSELFMDPVAIGCDKMRVYIFAYTEDGELFDSFRDGFASVEYCRNNWPWGKNDRIVEAYGERIDEDTLSQITFAGCIIKYENLTIHHEDGSMLTGGPQVVSIGVNFTKTEGMWSVHHLIAVSDEDGVTISNDRIEILVAGSSPLRFQVVGLIIAVPLVVLVILLFVKKKRAHIASSEIQKIQITV